MSVRVEGRVDSDASLLFEMLKPRLRGWFYKHSLNLPDLGDISFRKDLPTEAEAKGIEF